MANPQPQNGTARIAHEIMDALARSRLTNQEFRVLMVVLDRTYGYNQKVVPMSNNYLSEATGIARQHCAGIVSSLEKQKMVLVDRNVTPRTIGLQKDWEKWASINTTGSPQPGTTSPQPGSPQPGSESSPQPGSESSPQPGTQKKQRIKESNPLASSRSRGFSDAAILAFQERYKTKPVWNKSHYVQLANLIRQAPDLKVEEFDRRYRIFIASPLPFHKQQAGSLRFFCTYFDSFIEPITGGVNGTNGQGVTKKNSGAYHSGNFKGREPDFVAKV